MLPPFFMSYNTYFAFSFIILGCVALFCINTYNRLSRARKYIKETALPLLYRSNLTAPANAIEKAVLPIWNLWIEEIPGFVRTCTVFSWITLLLGICCLKGWIAPRLPSILVMFSLGITCYSLVVVWRRMKRIVLGRDLLYTICMVLAPHMPVHRGTVMRQESIKEESVQRLIDMINDNQVWRHLSHTNVPKT